MRAKTKTGAQHKSVRTHVFDKRIYVACALVAVICVLIQFRGGLSALNLSSAHSHKTKNDLLNGAILVPYADNICRLRLIDNATGQIQDGGLVNCDAATAQNTEAWDKRMTDQKASAIRHSFQKE